MTDIEPVHAASLPDLPTTITSLVQSDDASFESMIKELSVEDLEIAGAALSGVAKIGTIRAGRMAYEIRQLTPDGEWGREVFKLATEWQVSERTIHRWMSAAQEHFAFELTPAQKNSAVAQKPTSRQEDELSWSEDDSPEDAGFGLEDEEQHVHGVGGVYGWDKDLMRDTWRPFETSDDEEEDQDIIDKRAAFNALVGEPWAERDSVTPSPHYENVMPGSFTPTPMLLEPDETWVAFTASQLQAEHPAYADEAARRSAIARWTRKLTEEPLDLLEELEMIHGGSLSDEIVTKLHEAEQVKPIKPDEVTEGGKKKGKRGPAAPKALSNVAEKLMEMTRELHSRVHAGIKENTVPDEDIAALLDSINGAAHTIEGLKKMCNQAKDRVRKAESSATAANF